MTAALFGARTLNQNEGDGTMKTDIVTAGCWMFIGAFVVVALCVAFDSPDPEYQEYREAKRSFFESRSRDRDRPRDNRDLAREGY